jgi:hypothetical protein
LKTSFIVFLIILVSSTAASAEREPVPDLQSMMTAEDYSASGLDKLSAKERQHLADWVKRYREGAVIGPEVVKRPSERTPEEVEKALQEPPKVVKKPSQQTPEEREVAKAEKKEKKKFEMVAKVIPRFRGWTGKTLFKLDNGQVWQQRQNGRMRYSGADSTVVITTNFLGKYVMKHQETKRTIGVTRVE